jgi:hypothetical protein
VQGEEPGTAMNARGGDPSRRETLSPASAHRASGARPSYPLPDARPPANTVAGGRSHQIPRCAMDRLMTVLAAITAIVQGAGGWPGYLFTLASNAIPEHSAAAFH